MIQGGENNEKNSDLPRDLTICAIAAAWRCTAGCTSV
jgi:hypothetical protein